MKKGKFKGKEDKEIDRYVDKIIQISMFIADYYAIDKIKENVERKNLYIEEEKYLLYFLMDQQYSSGLKIFSEDLPLALDKRDKITQKENNPDYIFDILIKQLINKPNIKTVYIDRNTGKEISIEEEKLKNNPNIKTKYIDIDTGKEIKIVHLLRDYCIGIGVIPPTPKKDKPENKKTIETDDERS